MKKLFAMTMVLFLLAGLIAGCTESPAVTSQPPASSPPPAAAGSPAAVPAESSFKWPSSLVITTTATGGAPNVATLTWAPILEQSTGTKVRVLAEGTAALTRQWMKDKKYDFFVESQAVNGGTWFAANYADATREGGPYPLRVVWIATLQDMALMARGDSNIKTFEDIKPGVRIAQFTGAKSTYDAVLALVAWLNMGQKDVVIVPFGSWTANHKAISDGSADLAFGHPANAATVEVEASPRGLRWVSLPSEKDPEGARRFMNVINTWPFGPVTTGVESARGAQGLISPFFIYARDDSDPELVYNLVKWLDTNFDKYGPNNVNCQPMSMKSFRSMLDFNYIPVHEGTIKYLKETGNWKPQDDSNQKYNVDLLTRWEETYKAALAEADKKNITVDPKNADWIALLEGFIKDLPRIGVRIQ